MDNNMDASMEPNTGTGQENSEITLGRTIPIWWAMFWRALVVSMLAGFVLGFIGGIVVVLIGQPELGGPVGAVLGWLVSIPVSIWAMKAALNKKYKGQSLVLVNSA